MGGGRAGCDRNCTRGIGRGGLQLTHSSAIGGEHHIRGGGFCLGLGWVPALLRRFRFHLFLKYLAEILNRFGGSLSWGIRRTVIGR